MPLNFLPGTLLCKSMCKSRLFFQHINEERHCEVMPQVGSGIVAEMHLTFLLQQTCHFVTDRDSDI